MKSILKGAAILALGLAIGCGATGVFLNRFYRNHLAEMYSYNVGMDALLAESLRAGNAQFVLESTDRRIVEGILELHGNEKLKDLVGTGVSLTAAKRYYVCMKTEFPAEIAQIMNDLPPVHESQCNGPE